MSNARAARRRAKKTAATDGGTTIQLSNPVADHFAAFIVGNAQHCERVVEEKSAVGQHLVLCGAGPSLAEHTDEIAKGDQVWGCNSAAIWLHTNGHKVTHAFTCDQTPHMVQEWYDAPPLEYLVASSVHPHLVAHLKAKGRAMRFYHNFVGLRRPPVMYGVCDRCGSVMDPLFEQAPDCHEAALPLIQERIEALLVQWRSEKTFPQAGYGDLCTYADTLQVQMGLMPYEDWLYNSLYPSTIRAGSGLNSVNRAIDVALCMGFETITLLGADCALRLKAPPPDGLSSEDPRYQKWLAEQTVMHADGGSALASGATAMTMGGMIDGRHWETKVDMVISAVWLVKAAKQLKGRLRLVGDTLPNALMDKGQDFLDRLPHMCDSEGKPLAINLEDDPVYAGL